MIHFYNHDYKKALEQLESTLKEFEDYKYQNPTLSDYEQALLVKLMVNWNFRRQSKCDIGKSMCFEFVFKQI